MLHHTFGFNRKIFSLTILLVVLCSIGLLTAFSESNTAAKNASENLPEHVSAIIEEIPENAFVGEEKLVRMVIPIRGSLARSVWRATVRMTGRLPEESKEERLQQDMFAGYVYHLIDRIMQWWIDIETEYHSGDRIVVLIEPYEDPEREWVVRISALDYRGKIGSFRAYYFHETGKEFGAHYDAEGYELALHLIDSPVDSWQEITSLWGDRRNHKGIDYKCPVFTPIHSPMAGTISRINWRTRRNGNCLELKSDDSPTVMKFLHLEKFPKDIHEGMKVVKGDFIAYTGNTGRSTAPHLHFQVEIKRNPESVNEDENLQVPIDPYLLLDSCESQISPLDYKAFEIKTEIYDTLLFPDKLN